MKRILTAIALTGFVAVVTASQFHLIDRSTSAPGVQPPMPAEVRAVLERSCYDCHSNQTQWPWYSNIAPLSWLIEHDVRKGRRDLDFTDWAQYDPDEQLDRVEEIGAEVGDGQMPPAQYTLLHPDAVLGAAERALIQDWVDDWYSATTALNTSADTHRE